MKEELASIDDIEDQSLEEEAEEVLQENEGITDPPTLTDIAKRVNPISSSTESLPPAGTLPSYQVRNMESLLLIAEAESGEFPERSLETKVGSETITEETPLNTVGYMFMGQVMGAAGGAALGLLTGYPAELGMGAGMALGIAGGIGVRSAEISLREHMEDELEMDYALTKLQRELGPHEAPYHRPVDKLRSGEAPYGKDGLFDLVEDTEEAIQEDALIEEDPLFAIKDHDITGYREIADSEEIKDFIEDFYDSTDVEDIIIKKEEDNPIYMISIKGEHEKAREDNLRSYEISIVGLNPDYQFAGEEDMIDYSSQL